MLREEGGQLMAWYSQTILVVPSHVQRMLARCVLVVFQMNRRDVCLLLSIIAAPEGNIKSRDEELASR